MAYPPVTQETDATNDTATPTEHPDRHNAVAAAVNDIVAELGTDPSGAAADLTARLTAIVASVATEATDRAAADTDHAAAGNPHPGYLTPAEGDAAYDAFGAAAAAQAAAIAASQPLDADLTAIAALTTTSYGRALLALADAAAGRTALALGTAATQASGAFDPAGSAAAAQAAAIAASQPLDSDLTAVAALGTTSFGRSFLALADAAAGRTLLGLGSAATANTGDFDAAGAAAAAQAAAVQRANHTGTQVASTVSDFTEAAQDAVGGALADTSTLDLTYNDGANTISGAVLDSPTVAGATPAQLRDRSTHTGTQAESTVTGLVSDLAAKAQGFARTAVKTSAYSAAAGDYVPCDTTSGSFTVTLPTAPTDRTRIGIKHIIQGGTNTVTYACGGSDVINKTGGSTSGTLTLLAQAVMLQYDSSSATWTVQADDMPLSQLDARYAPTASPTFTGTVTIPDGAGLTGAASVGQAVRSPLRPTAAAFETFPRVSPGSGSTVGLLGSGRLHLVAVWLPAGFSVSSITFVSTGAASVPLNQWFSLHDLATRALLRQTVDDTTTAWGAQVAKTLALTSAFVTTYSGIHYVGINVTATTTPALLSIATSTVAAGLVPVTNGTSTTGLTTTAPNPAGAPSPANGVPYGYVS